MCCVIACDPGCTTCNANGASKCDGQAFCPSTTYFDTNSKTCKGNCIITVIIIIIIKVRFDSVIMIRYNHAYLHSSILDEIIIIIIIIRQFIRRRNMSMKSLQGRRTPGSRDESRTAQDGRRPLDQTHGLEPLARL